MDINSISSYASETQAQTKSVKSTSKASQTTESVVETSKKEESAAVIIETKSESKKATYSKKSSKVDTATIEKMKAEAEEKTAQLKSIVEKLLLKQSKTFNDSMDMYDLIKSGKLQVDDETRLQAQKDIAEDGYWGVEQTSERLFSFATALAGNDPEQADKMVEAFKKGYAQAEKKWGDELPDICKQTYDAFLQKMEDWKNSSKTSEDSTKE